MQVQNFPGTIRKMNFFKLVLITTVILAGILFIFIEPLHLDASDFMLIAWNPGHELLTTGAIYADYPYPLWTVLIMLPFTIWPPAISMLLWYICNLLMLAASIVVLIRLFDWQLSPIFFISLIILSGYFLPVLTSLWLGQLTIFSLLILALTAYTFKHQQWTWLGILLGLSFIKPQVMILLAGFILLWALVQRRWQVWVSFGATMMLLVLISLPFISTPSQVIGGGIGSHLVTYIQQTSTLWGLLLLLGFSWWIPLIISLLLLAWLCFIWFTSLTQASIPAERIYFLFSAAIIVNLLIIPYSWMHNLALLLLPLGYGLTLILRMKRIPQIGWSILLLGIMHPFTLGVFTMFSGPLESQAYQIIPAIILLPLIYHLDQAAH